MLDHDNHLWKPYKAASETLRGKRPLLFLSTPDHHLHLHGDLDDLDCDLDDHGGDLDDHGGDLGDNQDGNDDD